MKIERCEYCMHAKTKSKPHFCAGSEWIRTQNNAKRKQRDAVGEVVKERRQ